MTEKNISVLLIEDNQAIAEQLCDYLIGQGIQTDYAATAKQGLSLAAELEYDVIVLDLMLPDLDGIEVCKQIKGQLDKQIPVLMLTARDSLQDKLTGFDAGTDDYLVKPFDAEEVLVRCRALARRHRLHRSTQLVVGELIVDTQQQQAWRNNQLLKLTATDFRLLSLLAEAFPSAMSRNQLTEKVWGEDCPDSDVLRSHIYTLRSVLDKDADYPMIKTIHGVGFKLVDKA